MIETERLILRPWKAEDGPEFVSAINTPAVMVHLGGMRDRYDWRTLVDTQQRLQSDHGFCFWVVERKTDRELLGFCGLEPGDVTPIAGEIEIGWRLREDAWGARLCQGSGIGLARLGLAEPRRAEDRGDHRSGQPAKLGADGPPRHEPSRRS